MPASDTTDSPSPAQAVANPQELRLAQRALTNLLPTSPSSPARNAFEHSDSAVALLQSLVAFYHQERMWVYRTRAHLELALDVMPSPSARQNIYSPSSASSPSQTPSSTTSASISSSTMSTPIKEEPTSPTPISKWMRRKESFGLRLEGIRPVMSGGVSKKRASRPRTGVYLLEQFESMMKTRMESCERISNMVRDANHVPVPVGRHVP
ncbi:hypothetical protein CONPUDRAFT_136829 [Coniophora puteana RWD-64-598 SS2]|uniref:Uncharacterized protein n=1 Tax=Coniophora puteana (strain RWD-64-598) TaxID=741705 RepID=A0A5M3MT22_CONPW|nr:uncharacterized protein CONPUDRAFT_136829 [Coniophora puteana RWD-64-598 SS2]EIW82313.1 hypothetical protein CONPUDRAFT_136829 [Coniophora puteana RWD-64-598 SS2]